MAIWATVAGYEGLYEVSDTGLIRSLNRNVPNSSKSFRPIPGRIIKPYVRPSGYHTVKLAKGRKKTSFYVHRLVTEAFHGKGSTGQEVLHRDGDKGSNCASNLSWGTRLENMADRNRLGESACGERHGHAKLKEAQVLAIRADVREHRFIAAEYGISVSLVSAIKHRRVWVHLG